MDKSKWEYKKWADVLNIINGRDYKEVAAVDGAYPICGSGGEIGRASEYLCPENTVIIGRKGNINKPIFIEEKFWNIDTAFGLVAKSSCLIPRFLLYFCLHYDFERHNKAVTIPSLTKGDLLKIDMLLPSLSNQQRIVSELDCLNEMIALKQEQLKEFDKLAQSIFYDMFGDPATNEKGWRVDVLNSVCDVRDGTHDSPKYVEDGYPLITSKNVVEGGISFDDVNYISEDDLNAINARSRVDDGDIIMPMIGTIGKPVIVHKDREFAIKNVALIKFEMSKVVLNIFIQSLLNSSTYSNYILSLNRGGTQKFVSLKTIRNLPIILPPLALQQQFAEKIQAIESQKELVKKSIAETQHLLDSRMDYFFD